MSNTVSKLPLKKCVKEELSEENNFFLKEIDMCSIKAVLLKEIDVPQLKESLVEDIKASLLQEIDVSSIKEVLTKEIIIKNMGSSKESSASADETILIEQPTIPKVNLPAYSYGLTESFRESHKEILSIYENIMQNAYDKEYTMMPMMLSKFSKKCLSHFNKEEELYIFMKVLASSRSSIEQKVATEFTIEMKNLSVSLFTMLNQSNFIPVTDNSVNGFIKEFEELGNILQERISREEKILFPMYENSRKVVDIC